MSIFSKFIMAVRGDKKRTPTDVPKGAAEPAYVIPTVKFDQKRVTEAIKADLKSNIKGIAEFDDTNFDQVYGAALRSISRGGDLATLFNAIMELNLPNITKRRAGEISMTLNNKAKVLMDRDQQISLGITYAT